MLWVHLGELFLLAWIIIGLLAVISRQTEHHRNIKAMTDVLCRIVGHLYPLDKSAICVPMTRKNKAGFEYKTEDKPSFIYGDEPGAFRPMGRVDKDEPYVPPVDKP